MFFLETLYEYNTANNTSGAQIHGLLYHVLSVSVEKSVSELNKHYREVYLLVFIALSLFLDEFLALENYY